MNCGLGGLLGLGLISAMTVGAAEPPNRLSFPVAGFSIQPLEPNTPQTPQMALTMSLPIRDGFAGNVNVLIQSYTNSLDQYIRLSEAQFKTAGISLLKTTRPSDSVAVLEYFGKLQNRVLHWYARAELVNQKLYLVTATASEDRWKEESALLKACVDSFQLPGK
jgi:PsbP